VSTALVGLWASLLWILYVYGGYPLTLRLLRARPARRVDYDDLPPVTVVIAAHNEVAHIAATVRNKLTQDYPAGLLDIIVVSDGSVDGTDEAVQALGDPRVTLLRQEPRQGKTAALNRAVATARGSIVVFSDANTLYDPAAVRRLVGAFSDPSVGYVTGRLIYGDPGGTATGCGSGLYMRYENWLRGLETRVGSVVGVNGGIDAVRRHLYMPMRPGDLPDFVLPLRVVGQGSRVVYCDAAVASEAALARHDDEFKMRVRVTLRALHALAATRAMMHPRHGLFAFQVVVHKLLRYLLAVPLAGALVCSAVMAPSSPLYAALFSLQLAAYALAAIGYLSKGGIRLRLVFVPFYFALINIAAATAVFDFLCGRQQVTWTPRKGA
jgi:cellulose synthase/poly-beta-1,6-N-acetylglucosamine synthase-like glycosyltransferase